MRYIFIGGAHKSGSTLLARILNRSTEISAFENTGAPMDEGQWLQNILMPDTNLGELLFGLSDEAHLTESDLNINEIASGLLRSWNPYWDLECKFLLEKSPYNVLRTRLLQSMFPDSIFLITIRDPRTSYMAAKKTMPHISIETYFDNWFSIYSKFKEDSKYLNTYALVYYESFIQYPKKILLDLEYLLDVEVDTQPGTCVSRSADRDYMEAWNRQNIKKCPILNLYDYCC